MLCPRHLPAHVDHPKPEAERETVKSQGRWIIEAATHSVVSRAVHFGGSAIAAHPEIVDLEPNADARSVAITGRL